MNDCIAFAGARRIAVGPLPDVARQAKPFLAGKHPEPVLLFDAVTSHPIEVDFRGAPAALFKRLSKAAQPAPEPPAQPPGRGRPKLGVIPREVTLLPRHWDWLNVQPGGASVALRLLVEQARKKNAAKDQKRAAQESAHRFMTALAGNLPNYEEALRALYAQKSQDFIHATNTWPKDIRAHARTLFQRALC